MKDQAETEAFEMGRHRGHIAANWQEAQTSLPMPDPTETATSLAPDMDLKDEWISGFLTGWQQHYDGEFADGTPMDACDD